MIRNLIRILILISVLLFESSVFCYSQIDFSYHSSWAYLKGIDASSLESTWMDEGFDDSAWSVSNAPFRYGDGTGGTELADMQNNYSTLYLRTTFLCDNKDLIDELTLLVDYDDGFVIWFNGTEVLRQNAPSGLLYNSFAPANHESGTGEIFTIESGAFDLHEGENTIAVQAFNVSLTSSDLYFDLAISAEKNYPEVVDTVGIDFSQSSGFYSDPFNVVLTSPDPSASIVYTLDGSNPRNSVTAVIADSPATVMIDPASSAGRPVTPAVVLRASITMPGFKPSIPESRTFIFTENVKSQVWPGGDWPASDINGQLIDLEMDNEVVNSAQYNDVIDDALLDIPSVSVVTDIKNLFDPQSGIYVNASGHGLNWERECSVELIIPGGDDGFNVNAGLRIRGGWSRHGSFPKHSFRLFFREEYGVDKLYYPLFGDEGADVFDKVDLRTEQNYGWNNGSQFNSFVREVFSRDTQRDIGQPYTRSRYYHLYLNGMYWGLYQTQERPEARFASTYFGGKQEDYDVVKVNLENWAYTIEATDGNLDSWNRLWELCNTGFESNSSYFGIQGKDENGEPVKDGEIQVNIDNLIDYMLIIFYSGNFDSPSSSFFGNKSGNNFYAIDDRTDKSGGFTFYIHDAEHSLFDEPHSPGEGINEDRVNIADRTDDLKMEVNSFSRFHPQWLHYKLSANKEYRTRFADRAYNCFRPGGVFSPERSLARLNSRIQEIDMAVIAESARWGDAKRPTGAAYTKDDTWIPEVNKIRNNFIPYRNGIVIGQLIKAGLYSMIKAPVVKINGEQINSTEYRLTGNINVTIDRPDQKGIIIYTLNGEDPREPGGTANKNAVIDNIGCVFTVKASAILKARIYYDGEWSPLVNVDFIKQTANYSDLKVTEISYHPPDLVNGNDTLSGKDLEFIEFKNTGINALYLSGLVLDSAVFFRFPADAMIAPQKFYVIASKPSRFYDYYGLQASGNYKGNLSNGGEEILLQDPGGNTLINFNYETMFPWPEKPDGKGFTLSSRAYSPTGDPADYNYWTTSVIEGGTPFADNTSGKYEQIIPSEGSLVVFPNPTTGPIEVDLKSNEDDYLMEFEISDMYGRLIYRTNLLTHDTFDMSGIGISSGIYYIRAKAGSVVGHARIIYYRQ